MTTPPSRFDQITGRKEFWPALILILIETGWFAVNIGWTLLKRTRFGAHVFNTSLNAGHVLAIGLAVAWVALTFFPLFRGKNPRHASWQAGGLALLGIALSCTTMYGPDLLPAVFGLVLLASVRTPVFMLLGIPSSISYAMQEDITFLWPVLGLVGGMILVYVVAKLSSENKNQLTKRIVIGFLFVMMALSVVSCVQGGPPRF